MAFRDLRGLCAALEARGLLRRIPTPVSPELEIAEVADRVAHRGGPALLGALGGGLLGALGGVALLFTCKGALRGVAPLLGGSLACASPSAELRFLMYLHSG